jgi:hypothetical protein
MKLNIVCAAIVLCLGLALPGCDSPTPTVTPIATATPTSSSTVTVTPTATPTAQPSATATAVACATQYPMANLVIRGFLDANKDGLWNAGDLGMAWLKVSLVYATGVQEPIRYVAMTATGIWAAPMLPGTWQVLPDEWAPSECVVIGEYDNWAYLNAGTYTVLSIPFWETCKPGTPTPTPTPKATATAAPYACPSYQTMCRPTCDGTFVVDPRGECGAGLKCCVVAATPTKTGG